MFRRMTFIPAFAVLILTIALVAIALPRVGSLDFGVSQMASSKAAKSSAKTKSQTKEMAAPTGGPVLMYIEDDPSLRSMMEIAFEDELPGVTIIVVNGCPQAMSHPRYKEVTVFVSDVNLGKDQIDGFKCAELIKFDRPEAIIVFFSSEDASSNAAKMKAQAFLKGSPASMSALFDMLKGLLLK